MERVGKRKSHPQAGRHERLETATDLPPLAEFDFDFDASASAVKSMLLNCRSDNCQKAQYCECQFHRALILQLLVWVWR